MDSLIPELPLGFGIAFVGSMPMSGPVAVLFMSRLIAAEWGAALLVALGGSVVEAGYAFGIAVLLPHLLARTQAVILASLALGAVVVMTLGAALLFRPTFVQRVADTSKNDGFVRGALSSLFNPTLIATWTIAVGTLNANGWLSKTLGSAAAFALGVGVGSLAWFGMLVVITKARRRSVSPAMREKILRAMGAFLMASGVFLGVRFVMQLTHPGPRQQRGIEHAGHLIEDISHRHTRKH